MDARTGKKIRLGRLFDQQSHRTLIVAYSHGLLMGPRPGMRSLEEMKQMSLHLGRANGLMVAKVKIRWSGGTPPAFTDGN